jgi:hypothetical protein
VQRYAAADVKLVTHLSGEALSSAALAEFFNAAASSFCSVTTGCAKFFIDTPPGGFEVQIVAGLEVSFSTRLP